ncbi:transglutaminase-like domain-containing protein [Bacteroidota bacterium]
MKLNRTEMGDKGQLEHLVNLVDDDADEVRSEILKELANYGASLEEDLKEFSDIMAPDKFKLIKPILDENRRQWLLGKWDEWTKKTDEMDQLEHAMSLIAQFQYGINYQPSVGKLIKKLADEFRVKYPFGTEIDLSDFLFVEKEIQGNQKDYYNPLNSNLIFVIQNQKGIPISMSILLMLLANKLGFEIEGCNFPGHFLAKIQLAKEIILIDCFNNGKLIYEDDIKNLSEGSDTIKRLIEVKPTTKTTVRRVINNLMNAYRSSNEFSQSDFFLELLSKTPL